jgi:hypothetical protein
VISYDRVGALRVGLDDRLNNLSVWPGTKLKYSKRRKPLPKTPRDRCDACVVRVVVDDFAEFLFSATKSPAPSKILSSRLRFTTSSRFFSSRIMRTASSFAQKRFEFYPVPHMSCSCSTSIRATVTPFRGVTSTRPVALNLRSASRIRCSRNTEFSADAWLIEASAGLCSCGQNVLHQRTKDFLRERHG